MLTAPFKTGRPEAMSATPNTHASPKAHAGRQARLRGAAEGGVSLPDLRRSSLPNVQPVQDGDTVESVGRLPVRLVSHLGQASLGLWALPRPIGISTRPDAGLDGPTDQLSVLSVHVLIAPQSEGRTMSPQRPAVTEIRPEPVS